ncbi:MAG: hypothetical protein KDD10_21175 [Phaeodactylibacter sp.]|nr:hypothetical protein [Phaeodactylibacter sp.]MCB9291890.1 hypothetical protein [Lewinellaceae bacterium]
MSGIEVLIPILAVAGFWGAIILFVYMFFSSRHRERMALINNRLDAKIFSKESDRENSLKVGIVAIMAGIGVFIAYLLDKSGLPGVVAYFTVILIFSGVGLVGFYYLVKGREKEKERELEEIEV